MSIAERYKAAIFRQDVGIAHNSNSNLHTLQDVKLENDIDGVFQDALTDVKILIRRHCEKPIAPAAHKRRKRTLYPSFRRGAIEYITDSSDEEMQQDSLTLNGDADFPFIDRDALKPALLNTHVTSTVNEETLTMTTVDGNNATFEVEKKNETKTESLVLVDKAVLMFDGEPNEQVRKDVVNCLLLAQLNADKKRQIQEENNQSNMTPLQLMRYWMTVFLETMRHLNWVTTNANVDELHCSGTDFTAERILLDMINTIGNEQDKLSFRNAMTVLKAIPQDDNRLKLFSKRSIVANHTQMMVSVVHIDKRGLASMKVGVLAVGKVQNETNVLWFQWKDADVKVYKADTTVILDSNAFTSMRPIMEQKIQKINESYVNMIPL